MKAVFALIAFLLLLGASNAGASTDYEGGLYHAAATILTHLKSVNQLEGKRISVLGFKDMDTDEGCKPLSVALANEIDADINKIREKMKVAFRTVPRHDLDAIETEFLISKGGSEGDIVDRLQASDILVTGMWQDEGETLNLSVKAVSIRQKNMEELTAASVRIDKNTIPPNLLACLAGTQVTVETFQNGSVNWKTKIVQVKGWGASSKSFPRYTWKKVAEEAALADARNKLLEFVDGLEVSSKIAIKNYQVESASTDNQINNKVLKAARKIGRTVYPAENTAEVVLQLNLKDLLESSGTQGR